MTDDSPEESTPKSIDEKYSYVKLEEATPYLNEAILFKKGQQWLVPEFTRTTERGDVVVVHRPPDRPTDLELWETFDGDTIEMVVESGGEVHEYADLTGETDISPADDLVTKYRPDLCPVKGVGELYPHGQTPDHYVTIHIDSNFPVTVSDDDPAIAEFEVDIENLISTVLSQRGLIHQGTIKAELRRATDY